MGTYFLWRSISVVLWFSFYPCSGCGCGFRVDGFSPGVLVGMQEELVFASIVAIQSFAFCIGSTPPAAVIHSRINHQRVSLTSPVNNRPMCISLSFAWCCGRPIWLINKSINQDEKRECIRLHQRRVNQQRQQPMIPCERWRESSIKC